MYYTSTIRQELEAYDTEVTSGEGYAGTTTKWADIIEHKDSGQYAILAHDKYFSEMQEIESLDGWFEIEEV